MTRKRVQTLFFISIFIGVGALTVWMFLPYVGVLAFAATLAVVLQPIYRRILKLTLGHEDLAAFLTTLAFVILVLVPTILLAAQLIRESSNLYLQLSTNRSVYSNNVNAFVNTYVHPFVPRASLDLEAFVQAAVSWLITNIGSLFSGTVQTAFHILLGVVALFYFLRDGKKFAAWLVKMSPLQDKYDRAIFQRLKVSMTSVLKGSLLVAVVQGTLTGIGFTLFGVPNAVLWGTVASVCALIPGIGTSLVLGPAILFLFVSGREAAAFGLLVWGAFGVGLIDNFLGPLIVGRGLRVHPLFVLFAVIGGIGLFGPTGFLFGPLLLGLLMALIDLYRTMSWSNGKAR